MQETRNIAVIIVVLRAFKWTLRRTVNITSPPNSVCLSNTHVCRVKFSGEYYAALANRIIGVVIKKEIYEFSLFL
jgi:hypothetical protein